MASVSIVHQTVYVVDDEPAVLSIIDRVLTREGYRVAMFHTADDARAALEQARRSNDQVHTVLLDMNLGPDSEMTGEQFMDYLVGLNAIPGIVVMSGRLSSNDFYHLVMRGASDYLHKPFTLGNLLAVVSKHAAIGTQRYAFSTDPWSSIRRTKRDVFLSYCTSDSTWAHGMKRLLERIGISVWYADVDILPGSAWREEVLDRALQDCQAFLVLLTPGSLASPNVMAQIALAADRKRREGDDYLLVPLLSNVTVGQIPVELRALPCLDFTDGNLLVDRFLGLTNLIQSALRRPLA